MDWSSSNPGFRYSDHAWRTMFGRRGWLRPTLLRILEEEPMNGIEIINKIQEMSNGWWKPSPGSIYPLLEDLTKEKIIKKKSDGRYQLTETAKETSEDLDEVFRSIEGSVSYMEELSSSKKTKFGAYKGRIKEISSRLSRLAS